jgi:hypothetical protein
MLPDIDVSVAVELSAGDLADLVLLASLVELPSVPLTSPAELAVPVAPKSVLLLAVLFFMAFVLLAFVVVVSWATTLQTTRAARRMDEYRILRDVVEVCEMCEYFLIL